MPNKILTSCYAIRLNAVRKTAEASIYLEYMRTKRETTKHILFRLARSAEQHLRGHGVPSITQLGITYIIIYAAAYKDKAHKFAYKRLKVEGDYDRP